ncbi:LAFE_0D04214g1_1 [Lachancea fermentati]|uniref:LAFE_0D04214g1_1 n=1 Tax=Lachancea fermentati TaxID=4955 RepID=A0A1G4MB29_LACFM|nr:LAFE_0D04214g1_1 [Lachancea fermentati]
MKNEYIKRKVSSRDAKPCIICSIPTTCVLYGDKGIDWFYCCELHIQDNPQFATPIYPPGYEEAVQKLKVLKQKLDEQQTSSSGNWDTWVNKLLSKKPKNADPKNADPKNEDKEPAKEEIQSASDTLKQSTPTLEQEYQETLDSVVRFKQNLRKFSLNDIMFASRVESRKRQQALRLKKQKEQEAFTNTDPDELMSKFAFPSVPKA